MKKVITICLLVVSLLAGGMNMEAKTTKKKAKAKTSQTSSQWNEDIPSARIIEQFFMGGLSEAQKSKYKNQFINHGYQFEDYDDIAIKKGVCEINVNYAAQSIEIHIFVNNPEQRKWLYNDLLRLKKSKKSNSRFYGVYMEGNSIFFGNSKWAYD